jgi:MoaA/NifB/PqqE/SkfB family radical SAM enzyme
MMNRALVERLPVDVSESVIPTEARLNPYLHFGPDRVANPLRDRLLMDTDPGFAVLQALRGNPASASTVDPALLGRLRDEGWVIGATEDPSKSFLLKYVSLEAHTVCNQACYFCPVSIAPREHHFMPTELYERIVGELSAYKATIEAVFMINYNEPTADPRFVDQVRTIRAAGLPPGVLTNGTGLTPKRVDGVLEAGGLRFLSINLSTLDRQKYAKDRGQDQLDLVLKNLDYAKDKPLAEQMDMVVLGTGDARHKSDFEEIRQRFAGSKFEVKYYEVMDRAGHVEIGMRPAMRREKLCGCENIGSRPLQHLHITPHGTCVLCCEDYDEKHVVGDLATESVTDVLTSDRFALLRKWVYGVEEAPADFICRGCVFSLAQ